MLKWFICPDGNQIETVKCIEHQGCRMKERCCPLPYLKQISYDREWRGITPSMAGNGPRLIYLKRITDYAIKPESRTFATLGVKVHEKLAREDWNALTEEQFEDAKAKGILDRLEENEYKPNKYIIWDWKTWGFYRVCRAIGWAKNSDKKYVFDPLSIDDKDFALQLNRYRIMAETYPFKISEMKLFVFIRDATSRNKSIYQMDKNIITIPVRYIPDDMVLNYYEHLELEVEAAMESHWCRKCDDWESWNGKRCDGYCEVAKACRKMDEQKLEKVV